MYVLIEERLTVEILTSFDSFLILLSLSKDLQVNDSQTKIIIMYVKVCTTLVLTHQSLIV
jgi:hypothetical protein